MLHLISSKSKISGMPFSRFSCIVGGLTIVLLYSGAIAVHAAAEQAETQKQGTSAAPSSQSAAAPAGAAAQQPNQQENAAEKTKQETPALPPSPAANQQESAVAPKEASAEKNVVNSIAARQTGSSLEITVHCTKPPIATAYEMPAKAGIVVDIADAEIKNQAEILLPKEFNVALNTKSATAGGKEVIHLEFALNRPYSSHAASSKGNDMVVLINDFFKDAPPAAQESPSSPVPSSPGGAAVPTSPAGAKESIDSNLVNPAPSLSVGGSGSGPGNASGSFDGYDNKLITVDFFKIDLHNVFRLLGEISGANIVVAEGVSGTLTLSLHEVPWEFALDIILNLKDLAKEERHNTIVIYPKSKEFKWPEKPKESALQIDSKEADKPEKGRPVIDIVGGGNNVQPPQVIEAQKFVAQAIKAEKDGDLENAVQLYAKALDDWPDKAEKSRLANRIAAIYLSKLNQNAKAVYFAKKALAADKSNSSAALNAAIGCANMGENRQAQQYFDQSISSKKPSREALFNYAAFSEQQQQLDAALRLLQKYVDLYGENLDSMISRARILDKQDKNGEADKVYAAILHAGFPVPPDLRTFIMSRISSSRSMQ